MHFEKPTFLDDLLLDIKGIMFALMQNVQCFIMLVIPKKLKAI